MSARSSNTAAKTDAGGQGPADSGVKPGLFDKDGAVGSQFQADGNIGKIGEAVGGPLSSQGAIGKNFTSEGSIGGTVQDNLGGKK